MQYTRYRSVLSLRKGQTQFAGRNSTGKITVRHRGGGHKQALRTLNWNRTAGKAVVVGFEYDPQRNASLAKIYHKSTTPSFANAVNTPNAKGELASPYSYIIAPSGRKLFQEITTHNPTVKDIIGFGGITSTTPVSSASVAKTAKARLIKGKGLLLQPGDTAPIAFFETGDFLHAVEAFPGQKARFGRAAGSFCQILALPKGIVVGSQFRNGEYAKIRLPSGSQRYINLAARATRGVVGGGSILRKNLEKAGRSRWLGWRPSVRGVARNPVDHPHGGGQGKTSGGRPSVTFKSWPTKGQPTRSAKRRNAFILSPREKEKA